VLAGLLLVLQISARWAPGSHVALAVYIWLAVVGILQNWLLGPFFLGTDGPTYDAQAVRVAEQLLGQRGSETVALDAGKTGWPTILGVFYALLGRVPLVGILFNCVIVAICVLVVQRATVIAWGRCSSTLLFAAFACVPVFILLGPSLMREPLCWLGGALATLGVVTRLRTGRTAWGPLLSGVLILLWVRTLLGSLVLGGFGAGLLIHAVRKRHGWSAAFGLGAAGAALLLFAVAPVLALVGYDFGKVAASREYLAEDVTTGFSSLPDYSGGPFQLFLVALKTLPQVALGPFPWEVGTSAVWAWVMLNTVAWWLLIVAVIRLLVREDARRSVVLVCGIAGLAVLIGMASALTNYGIVVRIRSDVMAMVLPLVLGRGQRATADSPESGERMPEGHPTRREVTT
jgi:hypothetical protein